MLSYLKALFTPRRPKLRAPEEAELSPPKLPFDFLTVAGKDALAERERLLSRADVTPVIMGERRDVSLIEDVLENSSATPEAILAEAKLLDVRQWLQAKVDGESELYSLAPSDWPSQPLPTTQLSVHLEILSRRPKSEVIIGLIPTAESWQSPAFVSYGDWNDCPPPQVHVALHKKWHDEYGADIACMSGDIIECAVKNPPTTREAALVLAREQFIYCSDIVTQGTLSLEALAATLLNSKIWYFWWD